MHKAVEAKRSLLEQYGDWINSCVIVLGDKGPRLEVSLRRGGKAYVPREINGIPVVSL